MLRFFGRYRALTLVAITLVAFMVVGSIAPGYLSLSTLRIIITNGLVLMTISLGVMAVILTRNIDVSVGSILALSATVLGLSLRHGVPLGAAIPLAVLTGAGCGLFNGVMVALVGVPSIIATLGTLGLFRGLMLIMTGGVWIEALPNGLKALSAPLFAGLPALAFLVLAMLIAADIFLGSTRTGRFVYAVGDNAEAATHIGLPVTLIQVGSYIASGACAGFGGVVFSSQIGFIPTNAGNGIELRAIAACVLGGVSLLGGSGRVTGVIAAVFFLTSVDSALIFLKIPGYWNDLIAGVMLLTILLLDGRLRSSIDKAVRARRYRARGKAPDTGSPGIGAVDPGSPLELGSGRSTQP